MGGYKPLKINKYETGLVQNRQEFILPDDAFPVLQNAYIFRERIQRKLGAELLGRLRRKFTDDSIGTSGISPWSFTIFSSVTPAISEPNATIEIGSVSITVGTDTFTDLGTGVLERNDGNVQSTINYIIRIVTGKR